MSRLVKRNRQTPDQSVAVWETSRREGNAPVSGCLCCSSLLWEMQCRRCDAAWRVSQHGLRRKDRHTLPIVHQLSHPCLVAFHLSLEFISSPLFSLLSPLLFLPSPAPWPTAATSPPAGQDGLSVRLYSCSIFQNGWRMFYLTCLDMCSGCLGEGRSTIHQQERQAHGGSLLLEVKDSVTPRMCVFIP